MLQLWVRRKCNPGFFSIEMQFGYRMHHMFLTHSFQLQNYFYLVNAKNIPEYHETSKNNQNAAVGSATKM